MVARYAYDGWGNHAVLNPDGTDNDLADFIGNVNPFRYRGYYYDKETGLYFLKTRYYDPEICRFINVDDTAYLDAESINGLNLYAYCADNPIMNVDPDGTAWWHWLLGGLAAVALATVVVASAILTMGASLIPITVGFSIGAVSGLVAQGVANVAGGNSFFDTTSILAGLVGGLSGAAFATGLGGLWGAIGVGVATNIAVASIDQKSVSEIIVSGVIGGLSAGFAYGIGQTLGKVLNSTNDYTFSTFFQAAKVDGANIFKSAAVGLSSSWYKFIPSLSPGVSRSLLNYTIKKWRKIIEK